jgi:prepilin-type N-terminal cleavage/methylation domain-containing protein
LLHRIRQVTRNQAGFTLIELLIVILILGVLSGIVVFAVGAFNDDGKAAACKADVKTLEVAVEAYAAKNNGTYPSAGAVGIKQLTDAKYLKEAPSTTATITDASGGVGGC